MFNYKTQFNKQPKCEREHESGHSVYKVFNHIYPQAFVRGFCCVNEKYVYGFYHPGMGCHKRIMWYIFTICNRYFTNQTLSLYGKCHLQI